ncbi:flagellin [Schnuerera sp. xch1]|uniref:flagellin N-terminal helical domain-containing protein n=1 Tax=Schnuerera sp. xch1 TaxID=2874283 RepID=UPI002958D8AA|nr:flagellin [Schnuerera sp. xch1]MBZ2174826.1 flagellin [Schnuerera sp. xch1]
MRINNNLMALNTHRQLGVTNNASTKSMEKLSSGFRINRAGDDAAGLSISEKMRGQIRGLNMASKNAQDGISLIQTAEGALNESHAILQRMRELAVQAANDTNVEVDRDALQAEVHQLSAELTRIAETTEFNTQKLLDGDFSDKTFHIGANEGQNLQLSIGEMSADALGAGFVEDVDITDTAALTTLAADTSYTVVRFEAVDITDGADPAVTVVTGAQYGLADADGEIVAVSADGKAFTELDEAKAVDSIEDATIGTANQSITFTNELSAGVTVEISGAADDGSAVATATGGVSISSQEVAGKAITTFNKALDSVSSERSKLGALQNRLEHTIKNLDTSAENLQAAESRIRDVDMAKEMMEFTKNNILQQAAQAMLAQANQAPQGVLQLLR